MKSLILTLIVFSFIQCSNTNNTATDSDQKTKEITTQTKATSSDDLDSGTSEPIQALTMPTDLNQKKVALGDLLFHDKRLSKDDSISCSTCHGLDQGGAEHTPVSTGINGQKGPINSPTVYNSSYSLAQFWDGRAKDLKEQAFGPVHNPIEMGSNWEEVLGKLKSDENYQKSFAELYQDGLTGENIQDAIAEFERSLVTINSPFDKYLAGDKTAISEQAKKGYELFKSVGCTACHNAPSVGGNSFQKMGLVKDYFAARGGEITEADLGHFNVTKNEADKHTFKVPSLRVAVLTAPYFHDAHAKTIEEAITIMGRHQLGVELSSDQVTQIKAFLESLVGEYKGKSLL